MNNLTEKHLIAFISNVSEHGGELNFAPIDWLNSKAGYTVRLRLPANTKKGYSDITKYGNDAIGALKNLIKSLTG